MWGRSTTLAMHLILKSPADLFNANESKQMSLIIYFCDHVQVGFIANLRNERSHVIVEQVSTLCLRSHGITPKLLCMRDVVSRCCVHVDASPFTTPRGTALQALTSLGRMRCRIKSCAFMRFVMYHTTQCWLQALTSLGCMEHRGACSADADSGDGAGIMTQVPWKLFKEDLPDLNEQTTGCAALR